jgi:hypothetical protein
MYSKLFWSNLFMSLFNLNLIIVYICVTCVKISRMLPYPFTSLLICLLPYLHAAHQELCFFTLSPPHTFSLSPLDPWTLPSRCPLPCRALPARPAISSLPSRSLSPHAEVVPTPLMAALDLHGRAPPCRIPFHGAWSSSLAELAQPFLC